MELGLPKLFGNKRLLLFISSVLLLLIGPVSGKPKPKFFHRHHACIVSFFHDGKPINSTLVVEGKKQHLDNVTAQFSAFGRIFLVDLKLNRLLFPASYTETVYHSHGQASETHHIPQKVENCYYHGQVRGHPESEAALSTCNGLIGYITDRRDTYHIEPGVGAKIHYVYRSKDMRKLPFKCGTEGHDARLHNHQAIMKRHKRSIRAPYDSTSKTRYVELYLVNDYRTFDRQDRKEAMVIKRSQDIANIVSSLYRPLGIYVALVGVEVWASGDLASITTKADKTMENFLTYRKERINPKHHNDNAQLITGVFFDHGVVGKAIKGPICTNQFSGGVNMDFGGQVSLVATTVAHEMGHNFGMEHDNDTTCQCQDDKCIMAATSGQISPRRWSSCSQNALSEAFELGMDYCLKNLPTSVEGGAVCGNGFLEDGEDCDCGLPQDCSNRCCNAATCKLYPLAQCASGKCCDLNHCKPKPASTMCRPSTGECDLAEYCNGTSEFCPKDVFVRDGQQCKRGQSYCYQGQCKTHTDQCRLLWGESGRVSDPLCFQQLNMKGNEDGNCGYNWTNTMVPKVRCKRCEREDVMCGLLHCVHLNEKLMFWRDNLAIAMRASFLTRGNKQYVCRSAMLDVGLDMPDPGLVPDGAKCEHEKICIKQKCVALAKLKAKTCPEDCHGHGRCNTNGHCHCEVGYAPPLCDRPGYGGSLDSGPASNEYDSQPPVSTPVHPTRPGGRDLPTTVTPNISVGTTNSTTHTTSAGAKRDVLIAVLVVALVVIPIIILVVLGFLNRRRLAQWWKQMPALNFRLRQKTSQPPPPPPRSNTANGQTRAGFDSPRNVISRPLLQNSTQPSDGQPKSKVWNPSVNNKTGIPPAPPPERPAAPRRPAALTKTASTDTKTKSKKVRLSIPIQETEGPPDKPSNVIPSVSSKTDIAKNAPASPKTGGITKRESFRGSISEPVLVCTTNRNSLVLADGNVDIIGPEAKLVTRSPSMNKGPGSAVHRSQSARPVNRPDPTASTGLHKSASTASPTRFGNVGRFSQNNPEASSGEKPLKSAVNSTGQNTPGFASRPVPLVPCHEEDDTQPLYNNEKDSDLLSMIQGALSDSTLYTNLGPDHKPVQETVAPKLPPRSADRKPLSTTNQPPARDVSLGTKVPIQSEPAKTSVSQSKPFRSGLKTEEKTPSTDKLVKPDIATNKREPQSLVPNKPAVSNNKNLSNTGPTSKENALKGAVSDELRNKIFSRSGARPDQSGQGSKPAATDKPQTNNEHLSSKPASATLEKPSKPNIGQTGLAANKTTAKNPSNKPSTQSSNVQNKSQQLKAKLPATFGDAANKSNTTSSTTKNTPSSTTRSTLTSKPTTSTSKVGTATTTKTTGKPGAVSSTSGQKPASEGAAGASKAPVKSNVSSLAAKFASSGDTTPETKTNPGAKPVMSRAGSFGGKTAAAAGGVKTETETKPNRPEKPVVRSNSAKVTDRPNLPPKPGERGATTQSGTSSNAPKRVQSYRI